MKEALNSAMRQKGMGTAIRSYGDIGGHCYQNNAGGRSPSSSQSTVVYAFLVIVGMGTVHSYCMVRAHAFNTATPLARNIY